VTASHASAEAVLVDPCEQRGAIAVDSDNRSQ